MEEYAQYEAKHARELLADTADVGASQASQKAFSRSPFKEVATDDGESGEDDGVSTSLRYKTQTILTCSSFSIL